MSKQRLSESTSTQSAEGHSNQPMMLPDDAHNRELISHVHPADWANPQPKERYHLVVVGAGTGGLVSAAIASSLGATVALVERHLMGGDCLNVGCVPSKGVISAARAWHTVLTAHEEFGAPNGASGGDFGKVMERMRKLRAGISPVDSARRFSEELGIDVFLGHGRFVAGDTLDVNGARLRFSRAVIATGGKASAPPIPGLADVEYLTNETIFELTDLPESLGVIGGGPIGCELAQSFACFGTRVALFDRGTHVLSKEDPEAAHVVQEALRRDGVDLHTGVDVKRVEKIESGARVLIESNGKTSQHEVSHLLVAAGRSPNVEDLGLEAAGVAYDRKGIEVNDHMRTSNRRIFALGDVASKLQFTHLADAQARMTIQNAFFFGRGSATNLVVPWCTYTSPEVAHVGMTASEAKAKGDEVEIMTLPMDDVDRAVLDGQDEGFLRIYLKAGSDQILGGTLVAEHAGDMIGVLGVAMTHGLGLSKLSSTIFPYPTQGEVFRKAGDRYNRRKLTPLVSKLFAFWFKLFP